MLGDQERDRCFLLVVAPVPCRRHGLRVLPKSALYLSAFPEVDGAHPELRAYMDTVLGDWQAEHSYPENANGYNSIYFMELFSIMSLRNATGDLCSNGTVRMLTHFFDELAAPTGAVLSYGDDWNTVGGSGYPGETSWGNFELVYWLMPLEKFAATCHDPRARWTAAAAFALVVSSGAPQYTSPVSTGKAVVALLSAASAANRSMVPVYVGDDSTGVTTRVLPCGGPHTTTPDKLVLYGRTRAPCSNGTYVAAELLADSFFRCTTPTLSRRGPSCSTAPAASPSCET